MGLLRWTARRCAALYLVVVYVGVGAVSPVWDERDVLLHAVAQRTIDAFSSLSIPENAGLFGSAVDVDVASGIAVVGAPTGDSNRGASWSSWYSTNKNTMGTAFAFERQPDGSWIQTFEFVPELAEDTECVPWPRPDPTPGGCQTNFGKAVAVDANRVLIGAGGGSSSQGAVYVFERQASGTWLQTAVLRSLANSEQEAGLGSWQGQSFGHSVALDGDTALVGEPGSDRIHWTEIGENLHPSPKSKVGHVYAFECQADGTWLRKDRFSDQSGRDAATGRIMSGPSIIGSQGSGPGEGFFGASVALDDNRAIIGAAQGALGNREDPVGGLFGCPSQAYGCQNRGHAYIFERQSDGTWLQTFPELVSLTACRYLFSLGCVTHTIDVVFRALGCGAQMTTKKETNSEPLSTSREIAQWLAPTWPKVIKRCQILAPSTSFNVRKRKVRKRKIHLPSLGKHDGV